MFFGVRRENAWIELDDGPGGGLGGGPGGEPGDQPADQPGGDLSVRFGWYRFRTPLANLASWRIEGPFRWITAIGVRRSVRHGDVTFGGSHHGGVRIDFRAPVPWGPLRVPAIYVPADDLEALGAALSRLGVPGRDARPPRS